ncbi:MAG: efflux RND transporter periplasmic adaptor subunit [Pseudomonadota bacterium]
MTTDRKRPIAKRLFAILGRSALTLGVAGTAAGAVMLGVGLLGDRAAAVPDPEAAPPVPVEVMEAEFHDSYSHTRTFIGQIEAAAHVSLSFELSGRIDALLVEEGERVQAGQELARLDTDLLEAEAKRLKAARAASRAQLIFAESRLERAEQLQQQGFTSQDRLDQALALRDELLNRIAETDAALQSVAINLEKSVIYAPVSGQVAAQDVDIAETVQAGQQILSLVQISQPELRVGLPLSVKADDLAEVTVVVGDEPLPATLKSLRPDLDPVTRTRTALLEIHAPSGVLFGQTAALILETDVEARGAWVPLDALQSGKGKVWTLMIVVDDKLQRAAVEVLHVDGARAFVRGTLQPGDPIVVSGAHRVVAGQTVRVLDAEG